MSNADTKRYNVALPTELYEQIQELAEKRHTTFVDVIRKSLLLGLMTAREETPNAALIVRDGDEEKELLSLDYTPSVLKKT